MSIFVLKLIALIAMLIDHVAEVFGWEGWNTLTIDAKWLRYIGRVSFPIFAFCIVSGWVHSHNRKKYFQRLCLCAIISQIPYSLAFYTPNLMPVRKGFETPFYFHVMPLFLGVALFCTFTYWYFVLNKKFDATIWLILLTCALPAILLRVNYMWIMTGSFNVLYTLALGMMILYIIEKYKSKMRWWKYVWLTAAGILALLAYGSNADYGICLMGVILIVALYLTRERQTMQAIVIVLWGFLLYGIIIGNWKNALATVIPAALVLLYNSKAGQNERHAKYLFYSFYPVHLLLIGFINIYFRLG